MSPKGGWHGFEGMSSRYRKGPSHAALTGPPEGGKPPAGQHDPSLGRGCGAGAFWSAPLRGVQQALGRKKEDGTLRALFEHAPDAMVAVDTEGRIVEVNAQCELLFGYQRGELVGNTIEMLIPAGKRELHQAHRADYLAAPRVRPMAPGVELYGVRRDGSRFPAEVTLALVQSGEKVLINAAVRDSSLWQQQLRHGHPLLEALPDPLFLVDPEGKVSEVNEATVALTGVPRASLLGSPFPACFTEGETARGAIEETFRRGGIRDCPLTIRQREGAPVELLLNASLYKDGEGKVIGAVAVARDVTARNRVVAEYAEAKNYLDNILQSSTKYSIVGMDADGRILSWNEGGRRNYGYSAEEIVGQEIGVLHTREDVASGAVQRLISLAHEKGVAEGEFTRVRKDGSRFEASVVVNRRDDLSGHFFGYLLMSSDISDRRKAEERLRQAAQDARSLIEANPDPLVTIDPDGKITDVNEATVRATGVPREELVGSDFAACFTDPERARQGYRRIFEEGQVTDYPLTIRNRTGPLVDVLYNASVYRDLSGAVLGAFATARDITQRRRLDEELVEAANILAASSSQIMASISEVASAATETAATVSETSAVAEEVKVAAQLSNRKAHAVLDVSQRAVALAQGGRTAVDESVAGMGRIQEEMASIAQSITRLSEQSEAIGAIIDTVQDLAEQSNLLAVNAAIEAAKAGEYGKGFDVVAQEVKNLAEQSKEATTQVRSILSDIRKATKGAVLATEQGSRGVELGVRQSREAGEVILQLAASIEQSAQSAAQIAASSQEHQGGMDQIAMAMGNIKQASEQNVTGMRQVEDTLQNLHALGQKLKQLVAQYK